MTISQAPAGARETFGQRHLHTAPMMATRGGDSHGGPSPISKTKMKIPIGKKLLRWTCYGFIAVTALIVAMKFVPMLTGMARLTSG